MNDLDFRSRGSYASGQVNSKWTEGVGWLPIGIKDEKFSAKFDGNGYSISNLYIGREGLGDTGSTGLFGETTHSSEISNVRLLDVNVSGIGSVGGLVGYNRGSIRAVHVAGKVSGSSEVGGVVGSSLGEIVESSANVEVSGFDDIGGLVGHSEGRVEDSYAVGDVKGLRRTGGLLGLNDESAVIVGSFATGNVTGREYLGGLAGQNEGEITRSYSAGSVSGSSGQDLQVAGGLVGFNRSESSITSSYSIARVRGYDELGGLVGTNHGSISFCYASGKVTGSDAIGGLVAWNTGTILASYAAGDVSGEDRVGGLVGGNAGSGVIITSYAVGSVAGISRDSSWIGGLLGSNSTRATVIHSFWDTQSTGQRQGLGRGDSLGAERATTAQMQTPTRYAGIFTGWNLDVDNADGDYDPSTGRDDHWHFGTTRQYPALKVDFDGDGEASWQEFGDQR